MDALHAKYGDKVEFFMVYIREAHPIDGWATAANAKEGIVVKQPTTITERVAVLNEMCTKLDINLPPLVDGLDDKVNKAYSAWPDRLYLVGADGKVAYKGGPGPGGFKPADLELAIKKAIE